MQFVDSAVTCRQLLAEYEGNKAEAVTSKIKFSGVDGYDVYNISQDFEVGGKHFIAGRVEKRNSEISCVRFFERVTDGEYKLYGNVILKLVQDPCVTFIDGELVLGGTQIDVNPLDENQIINWRTIFFKGKTIETLKFWFFGPDKMKDVRLFDYNKDKILILSRPQGGTAGMGKIGMTFAAKNDYIDPQQIRQAQVFNCHFVDGEWGGANQIFRLSNGKIGVLGHIAYFENEGSDCIRHYHSMVFALDENLQKCTRVKIIARRADFEAGDYKRADIADVLFSGGLVRLGNGKARLYTGVSDCEGHFAVINDPFTEYEA